MSNSGNLTPGSETGRVSRPKHGSDRTGWIRWLPGVQMLQRYQASWLWHDIVAGLVLTTMLVPVGIAYAVWSGAGIVLTSMIGWVLFSQALDTPALIGIALILAGVAVINLLSGAAVH